MPMIQEKMAGNGDLSDVLEKLQNLVGPTPQVTVAPFSNWASTEVRRAVLSVTPHTVEEVQRLVRAARQLGLRLRAVGTGHSWTPLFSDEGDIAVHVRHLQRPEGPRIQLAENPDCPNSPFVTVATGVTTGELMDFELANGVCLPSNVLLREVQMGGVVAPACHGVGWDVQTVSDKVVSMRIVNSDGDLRKYSLTDDPDMMRAVQCNLGLWGIIVDMTFKVEKMIMVETENCWMKVKDLFYNKDKFKQILHDNWSVEVFWFPFNGISISESIEAMVQKKVDLSDWDPLEDEVLLRLINKVDATPDQAEPPIYYEFMDFRNWLQHQLFDLADDMLAAYPHLAPLFLYSQVKILKNQFKGKMIQQLPHAVHFRSNISDVPVSDMEWGFSVDDDIGNVCTATQDVVELVSQEAQRGNFPMNLPLEMRFIADSDAYMAPCSSSNPRYGGSGHTCQIEVLTSAQTPGWQAFCQQVADRWQQQPGARPHWCKEWAFLRDIDGFIQQSYSEMIPKYISALERSDADPDGMFFNDRLEKILYPAGGHPSRTKKAETEQKLQESRKNNHIITE